MSSNALRNMIRAKRSGTRLVDMHSSSIVLVFINQLETSFYNTTKGGISHLISAFSPGYDARPPAHSRRCDS